MSAQRNAMGALNLASGSDVERLEQRLRSLSGRLEALEDRLDELVDELAELRRALPTRLRRPSVRDGRRRRSAAPALPRPGDGVARGRPAALELLVGGRPGRRLGDDQAGRDRDPEPLAERQQRRGLEVGDRRPGLEPGGARLAIARRPRAGRSPRPSTGAASPIAAASAASRSGSGVGLAHARAPG